MGYYHYVNGQRYDDSLISNAEFRVRQAGDGRISKTDAQELWRLTLDGGRITEIEDLTLDYLLTQFRWTPTARQWLLDERAKPRPELKSYYRIIDGLRYDRRLLEKAEELTSGRGDGRISQEDARFLLPLVSDFGDVSIEEERTVRYILENFRWTDQASSWFNEQVEPISNESSVLGAIPFILRNEFELPGLRFAVNRRALLQQQLDLPDGISLLAALRRALISLLEDDTERSFRQMLINVYGLSSVIGPASDTTEARVAAGLQQGKLLFYFEHSAEELGRDYGQPARSETLTDYWIFVLELFDFTDDYFWVLVPRNGKGAAYNYADGPNFR